MRTDRKNRSSITGGVILIAIGAVFMLERFDVISMRQVWRLWPMFVIWPGLMHLFFPCRGRRSIFVLLIGIWLQISVLELWGLDFGDSWPLLLIFIGTSFVFDAVVNGSSPPRRHLRGSGSAAQEGPGSEAESSGAPTADSGDSPEGGDHDR